jgi:hypothetical protein
MNSLYVMYEVFQAAGAGDGMKLVFVLSSQYAPYHYIGISLVYYRITSKHIALPYHSVFMHYNQASHSSLVAEKTRTLDHPVRTLADDSALVHFEDKIKNKFVPPDSEFNLLDANSFFLNADGIRTKIESEVEV